MKKDAADGDPEILDKSLFLDLEEIGDQKWAEILQGHQNDRHHKSPLGLLDCLLQERLAANDQQEEKDDPTRQPPKPYDELEEDYLEAAEEQD